MSLLGPPSFFSPYGSLHSGCCCRVYVGIRLFSRAKLWSSTKKISVQKMPQESCALELSGLTTLLSASKMVAAPSYNNGPYNFFSSTSTPTHVHFTTGADAASLLPSQHPPLPLPFRKRSRPRPQQASPTVAASAAARKEGTGRILWDLRDLRGIRGI